MRDQAAPSLVREAAEAAWGLTALLRFRPDWHMGFDASARGFVRSFLAQAAALPFYLVAAALISRSAETPQGAGLLWAAGVAHILDAIGYAVLVAFVCRWLRLGGGYSGFIVVVNWSSLYLNLLLALASLAAGFGREGYAVFGTAAISLFALSLFITWRAARETLTDELGPALLMVVLAVGFGVLCDQAGALLVRAVS